MNEGCCPISQSPFDHLPWPDHSVVALILDGVAISQLGKHIYQWAGDQPVNAECLYAATRWEVMSDLSPWLVWLSGPEDPVLQGFLKQGPMQENGYLLVSAQDRATVSRWLRSLLSVETAQGCDELMRIAHPALARSVIGNNLTGSDIGIVDKLIVPDCISEQWYLVEPPAVRPSKKAGQTEKQNTLPELKKAFRAFNRRKEALQIWNSLGEPVRKQLGGPQLCDAYPALRKILDEALVNECGSLRNAMQFLFAALPNLAGGNAANEPAVPMDQG